jgi:hypothetical protein
VRYQVCGQCVVVLGQFVKRASYRTFRHGLQVDRMRAAGVLRGALRRTQGIAIVFQIEEYDLIYVCAKIN